LTLWYPDTCDCFLEFNGNENWIQTWKKCRLHERLKGQALLDTVMAQNRRFNYALGNKPFTKNESKIMFDAKSQNKLRIQREDLSNFQEDLPHENFIRRIFRI